MQKWMALLCIITAIGVMFAGTVHLFADTAVVEFDHLNVRSGPGTDFEKIGQVNATETYPVETREGEWVKIQFNEQTGWVSSEYITMEPDSDDANKATEKSSAENNDSSADILKTITIDQDKIHLRSGPSTEHDISGYAQKGDTLDVISDSDEWLKVRNDDTSGYMYKGFLTKNDHSDMGGLKHKTIVIDAGHGGRDVGAIGTGGTYEKDFTLKTTLALAKELRYMGANVIMTRSLDRYKSLANRSALANNGNTDAFISIHYNSTPEHPDARGIGSYYYHNQDKKLAEFIQQGLTEESGARDRGATQENYFVIRQTFKPSVLLELGFISNTESEGLLSTDQYQQKLVKGITVGIQKYFRNLK